MRRMGNTLDMQRFYPEELLLLLYINYAKMRKK